MERRTFCQYSLLALSGVFIPVTSCTTRVDSELTKRLSLPTTLAVINDSETVKDLGLTYLEQFPQEKNDTDLVDLLLTDIGTRKSVATIDSLDLQNLIQKKVNYDFTNGNTVMVKGWVLSRTEARQCALYSLSQNN